MTGPGTIPVRMREREFCWYWMARRVVAALVWTISVAYQGVHDAQDVSVVLSAVAEGETSKTA